MSTGLGRTGAVNARNLTRAVIAAYPACAGEADARKRLHAVLAAAADDDGVVTIDEVQAFALAGLKSTRDTRRAWRNLLNRVVAEPGGRPLRLMPEKPHPVVLCSADGPLMVFDTVPAVVDQSAPDLTMGLGAALDDLTSRGLPTWQRDSVSVRLARAVAATVAAVEPETLQTHLAQVESAVEVLTRQVERAQRQVDAARARAAAAQAAEAEAQAEIAALTAELEQLGDPVAQVEQAVRLANEILAAAALLEA